VDLFGVRLIGFESEVFHKLALTVAVIAIAIGLRYAVLFVMRITTGRHRNDRVTFWVRQGTSLAMVALAVLVLISVWFDNPARLGTAAGFVTAGLAIAAQRAVTAFAGYLVIMRGKTFTVGDRIKMGGVRGDVIALGFLQTRILEMGQPPDVNQQENPGMWVRARQYTGRIVTVTNDKLFDEPVYNFTREFEFIWEEIAVPVPYRCDRALAEDILLRAAREATSSYAAEASAERERVQRAYAIEIDEYEPRVFWRLTDNWVELTVRFVVPARGIREIKDRMSRSILKEFEAADLEIASTTIEISRVAPLPLTRVPAATPQS
jgi:small-conductance mechanosensitive channel